MAQAGHYAELYDTYFRHQSLAYIEQNARKSTRPAVEEDSTDMPIFSGGAETAS
jgi:hypothetical protein